MPKERLVEQIISSTMTFSELGQALAAIGRIGGERDPAALDEGPVGFLEARRRAHHAVLEAAALLVAAAVQRLQLLGS